MAIGPRLDLRHTQSLVMTPQLRQAIKLLQFSNLEVSAFVEEELERNPLLERDERPDVPAERPAPDQVALPPDVEADLASLLRTATLAPEAASPLDAAEVNGFDPGGPGDGIPFGRGGGADFGDDERGVEELAAARRSRREHLQDQLRLAFSDRTDRAIGAHLIALLEPSGRLAAESAAIAAALGVEAARVERIRQAMLRFEPTGMFARDLKECLAVQLAEQNRLDPAMAALLDNLDLLARHDRRRLMAVCGVDAEDLSDMVAELRRLDPKPGADFDAVPAAPVIPDILMRAAPNGEWLLELNQQTLPRLLVNHQLTARIVPRTGREERAFLAERLQTANWLVKSLQQRAHTILKVAGEIVRQQDGFFRHGVAHLRPLILRDIADAVEMHESTVSRVTSNKFMATPRGMFELKYFFTTAIAGTAGGSHSAEAVRHRIRAMVAAETAAAVLSDDDIVAQLRREGVDIARRTVAKYRDALHIPSSVQRRREKAEPA